MGSRPSKVWKSSIKSENPSPRSDKENHDKIVPNEESTTLERQTTHPKTQLKQPVCQGRKLCSTPFSSSIRNPYGLYSLCFYVFHIRPSFH